MDVWPTVIEQAVAAMKHFYVALAKPVEAARGRSRDG